MCTSHRGTCRAHRNPLQCILPPHMLDHIIKRGDALQTDKALRTLVISAQFRGRRQALAALPTASIAGTKRRTVYTANNTQTLPGTPVRNEGAPAVSDTAVNEAYDYCGATYDFYLNVFKRNSIDGKGMRLDSTVHYGDGYDNAFWNGTQMVYGDGDSTLFERFTIACDVVGHELTHGVTENTAGLEYHDQPGAINEHMSDAFGSMIKQYMLNQDVKQADWLIGKGLLRSTIQGRALRDMLHPGTAYDDPLLGKDPQPDNMDDYHKGSEDNGGVHINSGIPNRAFALAAQQMGGRSWETVGPVWYEVLTKRLSAESNFIDLANATIQVAQEIGGAGSPLLKAVTDAWVEVRVIRKPGNGGHKPGGHKKKPKGKPLTAALG